MILMRLRANDIPALLYIFVSENRKTQANVSFYPHQLFLCRTNCH